MSDVFKEYLIKQKKGATDILAQAGIIVGALILTMVCWVFIPSVAPLLICGIVFGAYYLFCRFNKEYEYILTNNELDIDVIYNQNSRKRVITVDLKKIDVMASIKDSSHDRELNKNGKVINASDNHNTDETYAIIGQNDRYGDFKILLTPNQALLNDMYKQSPSKIFKFKD